ncbi:hypothetical protein [[Clostridium] innocuum]|nr:hypothetical protein [[Clostridium] innocuum]
MAKLHGKLTHNSSHPYSKEALFILVQAARFEIEAALYTTFPYES